VTLKGSTKDFPLDVLLRLLADTRKTGEISIRGGGTEGALGLADGRVVAAVFADETKPIPALGAIFRMEAAEFEFTPWNDAPPANLEGDLDENLKRADEYATWLAGVREVIPHDGIKFRLSERAADQGAVTFTPDRWRVVMAVNTQPSVLQLATNLHIDRDEALTTLAGLVRDGVIETIEAPPPLPREASAPAPADRPAAPEAEKEDWSAALLSKAAPEAPPAAGPSPAERAPSWSEPADAAPAWAAPAETAPAWTAPSAFEPQTTGSQPPPQEWSPTVAQAAEQAAPAAQAAPAPDSWGPPAPIEKPAPEPERPVVQDWGPPRPAEPAPPSPLADMPQDWGAPTPAAPEPADDRLAALSGIFDTPAKPATEDWGAPATDGWTAPPPAPVSTPQGDWGTPPASEEAAPAAEDPRIAAIKMPVAPEPPAPEPAPNEWAPPPSMGQAAPPPKKKGLGLGGLFRSKEAAPEPAVRPLSAERRPSSLAGQVATFANALLSEYNSGSYGKAKVDERIGGLLMRVDEQADPIDRPLPIVDDRLDVQALERVGMPEQQAVPYLALLVSTIYSDAEKAFGRDKAKRGYKNAQQGVFGGDASALNGADLAGKLPKV
jgi:hypothetical protein